jgi:hypothetical protein
VGVANYNIGADETHDAGASLLEIGNTLLADHLGQNLANPMQTFQYRNGNDAGGRYGYVECLSTGTPGDHSMTRSEMQDFTRNLGRELALLNLLGVRDLHQSNMMISGKQPMFSDVEIAFDEQTLAAVEQDLTSDDAGAVISHFAQSQLDGLFTKNNEVTRDPTFDKIDDNGFFAQGAGRTIEPTIENFIHISNPAPGEPVSNRQMAGGPSVFSPYAADFAAGYEEMISAIGSSGDSVDRFKDFIDTFAGMHVRYHPLATGLQLGVLQTKDNFLTQRHIPAVLQGNPQNPVPNVGDVRTAIDGSVQANIVAKQNTINGWPPAQQINLAITQEAMVADLMRGDVPYFTRELALAGNPAASKLYHNGNAPIVAAPQAGTQDARETVFAQNPLDLAKRLVDNLAPIEIPPLEGTASAMMQTITDTFVPKYQNMLATMTQDIFLEHEDFRKKFPGVAGLV